MGVYENLSKDQLTQVANTIRMLSADGVEKANSGHPGMPMGVADCGTVLWLKYLNYQASDPKWLNRDRFVLSNGHGSMFIYSMLHLCGYDVSLEDLQSFRQWDSKTPGHPESFMTPGVECTTGPLGQGIANAVGMAIGQKMMAARYDGIIDHQVYCMVGDGCLMEGVSGEASSVAGHLGLGNLTVIYDDNHISIAGNTNLAFTEDVLKRYEGFGWAVDRIDGHDFAEIDQALSKAAEITDRPKMIAARTTIGWGSPNKANSHGVHGAPLGETEMELTKKALGWPLEPTFHVPDEVKEVFTARGKENTAVYEQWQSDFNSWKSSNAEKAQQFDTQVSCQVPASFEAALIETVPTDGKAVATRKLSNMVLQAASANCEALVGGSADLEPSTLTLIDDSTDINKESFSGLNLRFGVREHGMGAIMNGLSYYGGFVPYGSTFLCFSDYMRPSIRLAALSHLPGLFIFTHDSIFLGEDGPTHQPIEHVNSLRMIPNLHVYRPADGLETALSYAMAIERTDGPSAFIFTRQGLKPIERGDNFDTANIRRGAYSVYDSKDSDSPNVVLVATGSEVSLAIEAARLLSSGSAHVRVVSMPCWEVYNAQDASYQDQLIPASAKKVIVEAGTTFGWHGMVNAAPEDTLTIGVDRFGASAPLKRLQEEFGFTPEQVSSKIKQHFGANL